jgi:protein-L-isoaspartate(D-aspartate) O-methyltransferase
MEKVERHLFVPEVVRHNAYMDTALPIGFGQTISQPFTVAFMTQAMKLKPKSKVLEIGTGSGYQAAVLEKMGMKVFSIERQPDILLSAQKLFDDLCISVICRMGDGTLGWSDFAPYDAIIVTAGGPVIPVNLKKQLAIGGKMVIPVGDRHSQSLKIVTKISEEEYAIEEIPKFAFVPLIGKEGWNAK